MKEIWKDIKGYEGLYKISNLGNVKSIRFGKNKILKHNLLQGYPVVQLSNKNIRHTFEIHRLVAQAFIPNPNNYPYINHKNEIRTDYRIENLEWCTQKMNVNHSKRKMYHPLNLDDYNTNKYIYRKKTSTKHNNKIYTYYLYRINIPRINVDKLFSDYNKAKEFRDKCLPLINEFYYKKQLEHKI